VDIYPIADMERNCNDLFIRDSFSGGVEKCDKLDLRGCWDNPFLDDIDVGSKDL